MSKFNFKSNTNKKMKFVMEAHEVDPRDLDYRFRIQVEGVEYGFKGQSTKNGGVLFNIPPLNKVISEDLKSGKYRASIDVMKEGFFSKAWEGSVTVEGTPRIKLESKNVLIKDTPQEPKKAIKAVRFKESDESVDVPGDVLVDKETVKKKLEDKNKKMADRSDSDSNDEDCGCEENSVSGLTSYESPASKDVLKAAGEKAKNEESSESISDDAMEDNKVIKESAKQKINFPKWFKG